MDDLLENWKAEATSPPALPAAGSECQGQSSWYRDSFQMAIKIEHGNDLTCCIE